MAQVKAHTLDQTSYRTVLRVAPEHPCLAGHFPGHPLVPGVVLLEHVARALRDWRQLRLARIVQTKFFAPLYPDETAELTLLERSGRLYFELRRENQLVTCGVIEGR